MILKVALICLLQGREHPTGFFKTLDECNTVRTAIARVQKPPPQECYCTTVTVQYPPRP
jgi:hypothetical protein